jgi:hypothetical protein
MVFHVSNQSLKTQQNYFCRRQYGGKGFTCQQQILFGFPLSFRFYPLFPLDAFPHPILYSFHPVNILPSMQYKEINGNQRFGRGAIRRSKSFLYKKTELERGFMK